MSLIIGIGFAFGVGWAIGTMGGMLYKMPKRQEWETLQSRYEVERSLRLYHERYIDGVKDGKRDDVKR